MEKIKESEKEVNKLPSSNAEAIKLAEEYLDEQSKSHEFDDYSIVNQYTLSNFIEWIRKRK